MTKEVEKKEIKAWAVIPRDGESELWRAISFFPGRLSVYATRETARRDKGGMGKVVPCTIII